VVSEVLPRVREIAERQPHRTVFTRFVPPARAEDATGSWQHYFERWREFTGERIDPRWIELLPPLAALVPPAAVIDKSVYSPSTTRSCSSSCAAAMPIAWSSPGRKPMSACRRVLDAVDLGYRIFLPTDAMCSVSDRTHDALLTVYRERFGQHIETTDTANVLANWR